MGPLWLDVAGYELDAEDKELLEHPSVGGVILFARNFHDSKQLIHLNQSIREAARQPILIGVDQEGGRVQRFKGEFTRLPAAANYARAENPQLAAQQGGWVMATELIAHGIDLSFAPVLDTGFDCRAIGNRAFADNVESIIALSGSFLDGMKSAGMATTGKHFPGHGGVLEDSHLETPFDRRDDILENDMQVFRAHIQAQRLDAVMPAHVVYPHYDNQPASGSTFWLKECLRQTLSFSGIIFSDDLSMKGADVMGSAVERGRQSLDAGCDMILFCNDRKSVIDVVDGLPMSAVEKAHALQAKQSIDWDALKTDQRWKAAQETLSRLCELG